MPLLKVTVCTVASWGKGVVGGLGGKKEVKGEVLIIKMNFRNGEQSPSRLPVWGFLSGGSVSVFISSEYQLEREPYCVLYPLIFRMTTFFTM